MASTSQPGPQAITAGQCADPLLQEAVQVAANVSLSYNAPQFFILRASLLYGQPLGVQELVALEGGVQRAVGKLEAHVQDLQQQLEDERVLQVQQQAELQHAKAQLEVELAVGKASERALQQMLDAARADNKALRRQLHSSQLMLADSQHALALTTDSMKSLRAQLHALEQKVSAKKQQQQQQPALQGQEAPCLAQQQQQQRGLEQAEGDKQPAHADEQQQQQQEDAQHVTQATSTPDTSKHQDEQQTDVAADTTRQQDQQQQQQEGVGAQQSPASLLHHTPAVRQVPSPLLSPAPSFKRSGRDSPLTPQRPSRIPAAPEAAGSAAPLSYGAVLRRSLARDSAAAAAGGGVRGSPAGASSKPSVFKFTACPVQPSATSSIQQLFSNGCKSFSTGAGAGSSGNDGSRSSRRIVRPTHNSNRQHKQVPPTQPQAAYPKQQKVLTDAEGASDSAEEARKRRWR